MPNPASSGTGYLDVAGWIQMWGDAKAWKFMDGLHDNIAQYTHSGSKPCRQAGAGEFPIGVSFEYRAVTTKKSGAPIDIIFPTEGLGWDLEASGIMKSTKKVEAARALMDWLATPEAMQLFAKNFAVLAMPQDPSAKDAFSVLDFEPLAQDELADPRRPGAVRRDLSGVVAVAEIDAELPQRDLAFAADLFDDRARQCIDRTRQHAGSHVGRARRHGWCGKGVVG